jgi:hypothetical protein
MPRAISPSPPELASAALVAHSRHCPLSACRSGHASMRRLCPR